MYAAMCKSSSLAFVLLFAFLFRLETPTWKLVAIITAMTAGVVMMVAGEVEFKLSGFVLVISAAFFSGFRWGLTQILLLRNPGTSNPFSSIFFLAPVMFLTLVIIAIPVEGINPLLNGLREISNAWGAFATPLLILFPGIIAFLMTASEFALLKRTSVVTLSIAGIFKEAVTISAAALVFGDTLTPVNFVGLFVTLGSIGAYNWIKIAKMRQEARAEEQRHRFEADPVAETPTTSAFLSSSQSASGSDADEEDDREETAGLLRQKEDDIVDRNLFTLDGDMIPRPEPSPVPIDVSHKREG
jgi:solute carrier family 35, member C2